MPAAVMQKHHRPPDGRGEVASWRAPGGRLEEWIVVFANQDQPNVNANASTPASTNSITNVRSTIGLG